jgi:hypothetical protein
MLVAGYSWGVHGHPQDIFTKQNAWRTDLSGGAGLGLVVAGGLLLVRASRARNESLTTQDKTNRSS